MPTVLSSSTSTIPEEITFQERAITFLDWGRIYSDFRNEDEFERQEEISELDSYQRIRQTREYWLNLVSLGRILEFLLSAMVNSSLSIEHPDEIIDDALESATIYNSFRLSPRVEIELMTASKLKNFKEVTAIYTHRYRSELQITVLLKSEHYDNDLMYQLLDVEYNLQKQYRDPWLAFSYIPRVYKNRREIVHPASKLIYER